MSPEDLLRKIAAIQRMERGNVCETERGYNHTFWDRKRQKTSSEYLPTHLVEKMRRLTHAHEEFEHLVQEYEDLIVSRTRAEWEKQYPKERPRRPRHRKSKEIPVKVIVVRVRR
ncbi:MAG TPA: hypothetical protein VJA21_01330 [Verrucomicrobiae bacterium]